MFHPQNRVASRVSSSKDKGAKLSNLTEAVDHAEVISWKQIPHATFHNLLIDWRRLFPAMENHRASAMYRAWEPCASPR